MKQPSRSVLVHSAGGVIVVVVTVLLHIGMDRVADTVVRTGRWPGWLPAIGTTPGATLGLYLLAISAITYVITPTLVFYLGYRCGSNNPHAAGDT